MRRFYDNDGVWVFTFANAKEFIYTLHKTNFTECRNIDVMFQQFERDKCRFSFWSGIVVLKRSHIPKSKVEFISFSFRTVSLDNQTAAVGCQVEI